MGIEKLSVSGIMENAERQLTAGSEMNVQIGATLTVAAALVEIREVLERLTDEVRKNRPLS